MISKLLTFLLPLAALVSCASTPLDRIEKNPAIYHDLTSTEQSLVRQGRIAKGMSPKAVFLAWGHPDRQIEGSDEKSRFLRWDYTSLEPIVYHNYYTTFGS
ncbi:MAG: hypothetical protein ACQKBY_11505, partial [Verrucomicrobiales bacterium]